MMSYAVGKFNAVISGNTRFGVSPYTFVPRTGIA